MRHPKLKEPCQHSTSKWRGLCFGLFFFLYSFWSFPNVWFHLPTLFTVCIMLKMTVRDWYLSVFLKCWSLANQDSDTFETAYLLTSNHTSSCSFSSIKGCPLLMHVSGRERHSSIWDGRETTYRRDTDWYGHRISVREQTNTLKYLQPQLSMCFGLILVSDCRVSALGVASIRSSRCDGLFWLHSVILKPFISLHEDLLRVDLLGKGSHPEPPGVPFNINYSLSIYTLSVSMVTVISYLDQRRENKIQINFLRNCITDKKEKKTNQKTKKQPTNQSNKQKNQKTPKTN